MQPQIPNSQQATQTMLEQSKAPMQQQTSSVEEWQDSFDQEIIQNLEQHLNQIDPKQKQFLAASLQHYANIVIPVLGIVCGQEVMQYFLNIYKQNFAKGVGNSPQPALQPNSAPNPAQGQQPNQAPMPQAQAPQQQAPAQQQPPM